MEETITDTNSSETENLGKNAYKKTLSVDGNIYEVTIDPKE